jgi:hypothetical protein
MPDRLPSLILLVGCWVPAAIVGRVAADVVQRSATRVRPAMLYAVLATFVAGLTAIWFLINISAVPPYVPGATMDPTHAPPEAVRGVAVVAAGLVFPVSALACWLAFRHRMKSLIRATAR